MYLCPTGEFMWWGFPHLLPVSGGGGEVADSLGSSVVGSPEAVAGISDSLDDRVAGSFGDVAGLLSGTGIHVVPIMLGSVAPSSRIPSLGVIPLKMAPSVKVVKASWPVSTHECILPKGTFHQAWVGWPFLPNIGGPGHMLGSSRAVLPCNLGRASWDLE